MPATATPTRAMPARVWSGTLDIGDRVPRPEPSAGPGWAQALFCFDGLMRVEAAKGRWFIPDRFGIWLPVGTTAEVELAGRVEFQSFLFAPRFVDRLDMPPEPTVLRATPLMRGIGRRLMPEPGDTTVLSAAEKRRLGWVALDELSRLERPDLHLPSSGDPRLSRVMARLLQRPAEANNLARLAAKIGSSERTLSRLFQQKTGLSWREWRDRLRFVLAIEGVQMGCSSTELAHRLGYSGTSAFVAAFRRQSGMTPGEWRHRA
ncbi:helix-turn-helix domain-containing protein [Thioclava indica]|nr:AraC family transcriptional regulator [Thioclava indica]